jgi:hypothetical protein
MLTAACSPLGVGGVGVQYKVDLEVMQAARLEALLAAIDAFNGQSGGLGGPAIVLAALGRCRP